MMIILVLHIYEHSIIIENFFGKDYTFSLKFLLLFIRQRAKYVQEDG